MSLLTKLIEKLKNTKDETKKRIMATVLAGGIALSGLGMTGCTSYKPDTNNTNPPITTPGDQNENSEFVFAELDSGYVVSEYIGGNTAVTIPSSYKGKPVIGIFDAAFYECSELTSVIIPNSITSIGAYAFFDCRNLISVSIPNSVKSIGRFAFGFCLDLLNINIPNSVTIIDDYAFDRCDSLIYNVKDGLKYIGNENNPYLCLCDIENKDIETAKIDSNCRFIVSFAFSLCKNLSTIEIPDSIMGINNDAFNKCDNLNFNISNGLKYLGNKNNPHIALVGAESYIETAIIDDSCRYVCCETFKDCPNLTSVTLSKHVTNISAAAFYYSDSLTNISVDEYNTTYKSIDGNLYTKDGATLVRYAKGKMLASFNIPEGVKSLDNYAFIGSNNLTSIIMPNSVTSIGGRAFAGCASLKSVTMSNNVSNIGSCAFLDCTSLNNIEIPKSVTRCGVGIFYRCSNLKNARIANNTVAPEMFYKCVWLTNIELLNGVISIRNNAFNACPLTSVTIPNSVTIIGDYAFYDCRNLISVSIPNSVKSIGRYAFAHCSDLLNINIPNSVTSIGDGAFGHCDSLTSITIPKSVTSIGGYAFNGCISLKSIKYRGTEEQWSLISKGVNWNPSSCAINYNYTGE